MAENSAMFQRVYLCLRALKQGFLKGCRPFVGLDGCFLNGSIGVLLTAIGCHTDGQVYTFAYVLVEKENYGSV